MSHRVDAPPAPAQTETPDPHARPPADAARPRAGCSRSGSSSYLLSRGSDEFDHAYRAAAAARGQWGIDPVDATRGTGAFLRVPADIVEAAQPECQDLRYTRTTTASASDRRGRPHRRPAGPAATTRSSTP